MSTKLENAGEGRHRNLDLSRLEVSGNGILLSRQCLISAEFDELEEPLFAAEDLLGKWNWDKDGSATNRAAAQSMFFGPAAKRIHLDRFPGYPPN